VIGLYQEPGWEIVTALFLPETTDSLFLRLRPTNQQVSLGGAIRGKWFNSERSRSAR
jgi:hypothetical protein